MPQGPHPAPGGLAEAGGQPLPERTPEKPSAANPSAPATLMAAKATSMPSMCDDAAAGQWTRPPPITQAW